jgi:hypothetical protein
MKTRKDFFEELPEPYRTQAINNTNEQAKITNSLTIDRRYDGLTQEAKSLEQALGGGFRWLDSPEGFNYWNDVVIKIERGLPLIK